MRRLILFFLIVTSTSGYMLNGQKFYKYWIELSDKTNTPYSIDQPEEFLSERAIQRRLNQGIQIEQNDLPVDPSYVEEIEMTGGRTIHTSRWFNAILYETADSLDVDKIAEKDFVKDIYPVYWGDLSYFTPPARKKSASEDYYDYGSATNQIMLNNGQRFHNEGYRGEGMIIAVLDAGFKNADTLPAFDSLWANDRIILSKDFVQKGNDVFREHPHGTNVLSLMGGNLPGELVGTAPEAVYMLLRSEDGRTEWRVEEINWIAAAEFADSAGADVINSSLGYSLFDMAVHNYSTDDMDGNTTWITRGADLAASKGILVVSSAGNSGNGGWKIITAPADGDSVLAVGAVDSTGTYASFSSRGPTADGRVKPNVMAQGFLVYVQSSNGLINKGNGTSFAAPIITGLATCLWQKYPEKTNYEIIRILEQSSSKYPYPNNQYGYGIPNLGVADDIITNAGIDIARPNVDFFPNPVEDKIHLRIPPSEGGIIEVRIFDATGKLRQVIPGSVISRDTGHVLYLGKEIISGIYIAQITTDINVMTLRFIKE